MTFASALGIPADGTTDCVPAFEAAIANPAVTSIEFEPGHYRFGSQVELKSGLSIRGFGRSTRFSPLPSFTPRTHLNNAIISTQPNSLNIVVSDILFEGLGIGTESSAARIHALVMRRTTNFRVRRCLARDWSGYAYWASGSDPVNNDRNCSGDYEDCWAENCNVLFEANLCRGVRYKRCHGSDGKRTVSTEVAFHPWNGAEKVTYEDCTYIGAAGAGISVLGVGQQPIKEILFRRCRIQTETGTTALIAGYQLAADKPFRIQLTVEDSEICSVLGNGANLYNVDATFRRTKITGYSIAAATAAAVGTEGAVLLFEDSDLLASNDPNGTAQAHALRLDALNTATVTRGSLRARGKSPVPYIKNSSATLVLSPPPNAPVLEPAP